MDNKADDELIQGRIRNLWENTDFTATLFDSLVGYGIIAADFDGNVLAFNRGAAEIFGYGPKEVIGARNIEMFYPFDFVRAGRLQEMINDLVGKGRYACENMMVRKNGETFPAQIIFTLAKDKDGRVSGFVEIVEDISGRRQAENELLERTRALGILVESNASLTATVRLGHENIYDAICSIMFQAFALDTVGFVLLEDEKGFCPVAAEGIDENDTARIRFIWDCAGADSLLVMLIAEGTKVRIINDLPSDGFYEAWQDRAVKMGYKSIAALPLVSSKDSASGMVVMYSRKARFFSAEKINLISLFINNISVVIENMILIEKLMSEQHRAENSEVYLKSILESIGEGLIVVDPQYRITTANRAFCEQSGRTLKDCIGQLCYMVSHDTDVHCFTAGEECPVKKTLETGKDHSVVHTHYGKGRQPVYIEIHSFPMRDASGNITSVIEICNDITERMSLEEHVRQNQKLDSIGTMAGGIAHDFNNILNVIMGYGGLMRMKMKKDDPMTAYLREITDAAERAAHLTQGLLAFSRKQIISPKPVDFNDIIRSIEKLLQRLVPEDITFRLALSDKALTVLADTGQMDQVLINLCSNAKDAMLDGGRLTLETDTVNIDGQAAKKYLLEKPGLYALISVTDTGAGMDEYTRERIFEPFFTTKEVGRGTGLGLSIVFGIIKQHKGHIDVISEYGKGTTFRIYLPMISATPEEAVATLPLPTGGTETILVAEDDAAVRGSEKTTFEQYGYTVIEAVDGQDAVHKFIESSDRIQLVILDVVMPGMSGKEAYEEIRKARPDVKALFTSGYTADIIHKKGINDDSLNFISKPVSPVELLRKMREVLDG